MDDVVQSHIDKSTITFYVSILEFAASSNVKRVIHISYLLTQIPFESASCATNFFLFERPTEPERSGVLVGPAVLIIACICFFL